MSLKDEGLGDIRVKKGPSHAFLIDNENPVIENKFNKNWKKTWFFHICPKYIDRHMS